MSGKGGAAAAGREQMPGSGYVEIDGLRAGYERSAAALTVDSLTLRAGELAVLLGQNGSGKSTLLRVLAGQLPYEGSVKLLISPHTGGVVPETGGHESTEQDVPAPPGQELRTFAPRVRARRIAYLPQQLGAPEMDVETLVAHGRFSHRRFTGTLTAADRERIERAMEQTEVADLRARRLRALSGGERQRAWLAMVVAQDAPFLLLDEPCASLDIAHQQHILAILKELAAEGRGILMASHDIPQSLTIGDQICLLHQGVLRFVGAPETLAGAERRALLANALGVGVRRLEEGDALYSYALTNIERL